MSHFDTLVRKRGNIKFKLTNFSKYFEALHVKFVAGQQLDSQEIIELQIRIDKLETLISEFEQVQDDIEMCCALNQLDKQYDERSNFTDSFYKILAKAKEVLEEYYSNDKKSVAQSVHSTISNAVAAVVPNVVNDPNAVKLPPIKCPVFNCESSKWLEFKDTFQALFHNNVAISDIQKYHYLRSCLGEDALKIISSLEFAAHNYKDAWTILCDRFDNPRLLVNNHLKSLFDLETLTKESSLGLRNLMDTVNKHLRALKTLKLPTDHWDAMVVHMVSLKLDKNTNREWEQSRNDKSLPTLSIFFEFLKNRADFLETIEVNNVHKPKDNYAPNYKIRSRTFLEKESNGSGVKCNFCKKDHLIYTCDKFLKLSVSQRWEKVKQLRLCSNCLCFGHYNQKCQAGSCKLCSGKHSSLLHYKKNSGESDVRPKNHIDNTSLNVLDDQVGQLGTSINPNIAFNGSSVICASNNLNKEKCVLLSTALINVQDKYGQFHKVQALLDSGSQCSFISEILRKRLGLDVHGTSMYVTGLNDVGSSLKQKCEILINSTLNDFQTSLMCLVVPRITGNLPAQKIDISNWSIPNNISLANPTFHLSKSVDILIGADLFWSIICNEKINLGKNKPILMNTVFGYVAAGPFIDLPEKTIKCNFVVNDDLQKFWDIEEVPSESLPLTQDEQYCEDYFNQTVSRDLNSGKFVVRFPFKESPMSLGDSKNLAIKKLLWQENRLKKNDLLNHKYTAFMNEYIKLEHMRKLTDKDSNKFKCFLPHFAVVREDSVTSNVRIVFDASVKTQSGISLNDIQYPGPAIQNDIFGIMLRFREHRFVVIADVAKMYRQILIHPDERYLQNIVWRSDPHKAISIYELQTVTYGTTSAPYLAIKCIKKLALDNKDNFPIASELIDRDMYVDDLITGFDDEQQGILACNQISDILKSTSFSLRKWASNSKMILNGLKDTSDEFSILNLGENDVIKTLGIQWLSQPDLLSFKVTSISKQYPVTKRNLLSTIARIYDPLGLVSPSIILVKILIQRLWSLKLGWDDVVPPDLGVKWNLFQCQLNTLNNIKIPRYIKCDNPTNIEIHGFSDASMEAYSAVVYVRSLDVLGNVCVRLLCSKTKVAPVKVLTIPRLELCGALILARLVKRISDSLINSFKIFYWCDSQIVLSWLNSEAGRLQVFVSNRVAEIQRLSDISHWSYINTKENPADVASRGVLPEALLGCKMWWDGPLFLLKECDWPRSFRTVENLPEIRSTCKTFLTTQLPIVNFERFSNLNRIVRAFAYSLRFITILKTKNKIIGNLTVLELENSMFQLVKMAQNESFANELSAIRNEKSLKSTHRLLSLNPFLDSSGLLRVGGRLKFSTLSFNEKHPLLLDRKHVLTKMIFRDEHLRLQHAGPQLLLFSLRQRYWVPSGMNVAKQTVRLCVKCFRAKPKTQNSLMGDLPKHRVQIAKPFSITGIDYAGPMMLRDRKGRPYKTYKAYICLFVCFVTKALHIELVTDLTSEAFLATFRRFAARRGTPTHLYSDNGSNFIGAQRELDKLYQFLKGSQNEFVQLCASEKITWHFIPPHSPNFGGLWESNIKCIKQLLYRVIGQTVLTFEEYYTLLVQIEATLNSRPLYPMSSDPNDLSPLTPAHLLIGQSLVTPPDPLFEDDVKINRLSRFQLLQQLNQSFWKRWSGSYLTELQRRSKWRTKNSNVEVGDMVVIKNDNLPPSQWLLGRIEDVHPGSDGQVRVATVRTANGIYKRSVSKICPLPQSSDDNAHGSCFEQAAQKGGVC